MLPPLGKNLSATGTHLQWKHSLHQWGLTPVLTTLDARSYTQKVAKQNQHNGTFVECLSHIALRRQFVLLGFSCIFGFIFCLLLSLCLCMYDKIG